MIPLSLTHADSYNGAPSVMSLLLRGGSTGLKITWVQQRQHHKALESARERMLSLALRRCETLNVSLAPPRTSLKLSLSHSIVFHMLLRRCETLWNAREIASMVLLAKREKL